MIYIYTFPEVEQVMTLWNQRSKVADGHIGLGISGRIML